MQKPEGLPSIPDVVLHKCNQNKLPPDPQSLGSRDSNISNIPAGTGSSCFTLMKSDDLKRVELRLQTADGLLRRNISTTREVAAGWGQTQEDGDRTRHQSPPSSSSPVRIRSPLSSSSPVRTQSPPSHLSPVRTQFLPSSSSPVRTRSPPSSSSPL
ncbi:hypothetical protein HF521_016897 [Silurus meridionalis]|uniref:Uncharacterized protein n=1 Tax=Silurus meridionalis TaxID=175797 RepID=A0A8T0BR69_SILME|nr:hypothetical protein HF521_016897 [Silurus meridionalis]